MTSTPTFQVFQYPQTDRCPCNENANVWHVGDDGAFSILKRIDAPATAPLSKENPTRFPQKYRHRPSDDLLRAPNFIPITPMIVPQS